MSRFTVTLLEESIDDIKIGKRFPFAVYYEKDGEEARVVAVLDMRQNPKSIREILRQRNG